MNRGPIEVIPVDLAPGTKAVARCKVCGASDETLMHPQVETDHNKTSLTVSHAEGCLESAETTVSLA